MSEILENNIEVQMAESHLFLYLADVAIDTAQAQVQLKEVGGEFVDSFHSVMTDRRCLIYQYGVHPEGALLDLKDLKQQLRREWVSILSLRADFSEGVDVGNWILEYTPSYHTGYASYTVSATADKIDKAIYNSQGLEHTSCGPSEEEANAVVQIITRILQRDPTVQRAEQLLYANNSLIAELGNFCMSAEEEGIPLKEYMNEAHKLKKLVQKVKFK